jgi:hypothetical protein
MKDELLKASLLFIAAALLRYSVAAFSLCFGG